MQFRLLIVVGLLFCLASCDRMNGFRILNASATPLLIGEQFRDRTIALAPGETSSLLLVGKAGEYEIRRPSEPGCRYDYPSIESGTFPLPEGRRILDGKEPRTVTLVVVQDDLVARAYAFRRGVPVESLSELRRGGFPAGPVRTCA